MYGVRGSQTIPRETNLLFSSAFKHPDGQFVKSKEFASSDLYLNQQNQPSSGLMRYRSAPSSFFASLVDGGAVGCEEFLNPHQSSSPESEAIFARFVSSNGDSEPQDLQFATKNETPEANQYNMYQNSLNHNDLSNPSNLGGSHANIDGLYKVTNGAAMRSPVQGNANSGNCSNLVRQSSSPPGLFSNLAAENGFSVLRDGGNFKVGNGANGRANQTSRLNDHINFSSGPSSSSRFMPQIIENRNESSSPENGRFGNANSSNGFYGPSFQNDSWNNSGFTGIKRNRDDEEKFSGFTLTQSQNEDSRNYTTGLTHHLSLPKTSAELAAIEKYLQFQQDAVPCKTRAKRGCATHPRSIAERMRRTRISQRMKKLQELFPNMDKQTNTADMLDLAVEYIKDLQKQVTTLADTRAKCKCSSMQKQISSPTV